MLSSGGFRQLLLSRPFRIFYCYVALIFAFSIVYYVAYCFDDDGFVFNKDIRDPRFTAAYQETVRRLKDIQEERAAVMEVQNAIAGKPVPTPRLGQTSTVETPTYVAVFSSKMTIRTTNDAAQPIYFLDVKIYDKKGKHLHSTGDSTASPTKKLKIDLAESLARLDGWLASAQGEQKDFDAARTADENNGDRHPEPRIWRLADFFYFSVITQTTVGYGDILPNQTYIRMIVAFQIICGLVLLSVAVNMTFPGQAHEVRQSTNGEIAKD